MRIKPLRLTMLIILAEACQCDGPSLEGTRFACAATNDCREGRVCLGGVCVDPSSAGGEDEPVCSANGWCLVSPLPTSNLLRGVWAASDSDIWAVGEYGTIVHYDGAKWLTAVSNVEEHLYEVWGASSRDVWAVGGYVALHWDGDRWSKVRIGEQKTLYAVWGTASDDVWAAGEDGTAFHYDGKAWAPIATGTTKDLYDVGGLGKDDVWAVGQEGVILHWGGASWAQSANGSTADLYAVWAGESLAWAAGDGPTLLKWTPATDWQKQDDPRIKNSINSLWGSGPNDLWAAGDDSIFLHWNGANWGAVENPSGLGWGWWGLHGPPSGGSVFGVGQGGLVSKYSEGTWKQLNSGQPHTLNDLWGAAADDIWAVGANGQVLRWQGSKWNPVASDTISDLISVWGFSPTDVWAVGFSGTVQHWTGADWTSVEDPVFSDGFFGVWGTAPNDFWLAGNGGTLVHRTAAGWTAVDSGVTQALNDLWGPTANDVWAVGYFGTIVHWDGGSWARFDAGTDAHLYAVWGSASNHVYAVGAGGARYVWDGIQWTEEEHGVNGDHVLGVTAVTQNDVWLAESGGKMQHFDGVSTGTIEDVPTPTHSILRSAWGAADAGVVWAVGENGTILRLQR